MKEQIEIGLDKKKTVMVIIGLVLMVLGMTYFTYVSQYYDDNLVVKYLSAPIGITLLYQAYRFLKQLVDRSFLITITSECLDLKLNDKTCRYYWRELSDITFEKTKENKNFMHITGSGIQQSVNIDGYENHPSEIERLISESWRTYNSKKLR